ncbi:MAG: hypothetical protein KDK25_15850, partial [Leptospiraceae bacterium]|nr:hypothetical protein [Leptospiraceae bacterium]
MFFDDAFTLFLQSIGRTEEIDFYLKKFRQDSSRYFALIVPDVESLREAPELLRTHLNFLSRLGLFPAVLITEPFAEECVTVFSSERLFRIHDLEGDKLTSGMPESGSGRKISV